MSNHTVIMKMRALYSKGLLNNNHIAILVLKIFGMGLSTTLQVSHTSGFPTTPILCKMFLRETLASDAACARSYVCIKHFLEWVAHYFVLCTQTLTILPLQYNR